MCFLRLLFCIVFMSPEAATTSPCREVFTADYVKKHLALVAIDEAHCVLDWLVGVCQSDILFSA